jgi:uncharacterized protein (TIGR00730 family)
MNPTQYPDGDKKKINITEKDANILPISADEIATDLDKSLQLIHTEFKQGFEFIQKYDKSVSFFGSARFPSDDHHCIQAEELAGRIVKELGYAIVTGGGPGIMQAANKGAFEAGGESLGLTIKLPKEQITNPYVKDERGFYYFFTRKTILTFAAEAFIFFPGGFGTLDEFFDILTLVQTKKIPQVPIILVGRDYWQPLQNFIIENMYEDHNAIGEDEIQLYTISDDFDEIIEIIKKAPVSKWWQNYEM